MLKRRCKLLAAAGVAALVLAPAGLANHGKKAPPSCVSAVCVYSEPNVPGVGGPSYGRGTGKPVPLSSPAARALDRQGGKDRSALEALAKTPSESGGVRKRRLRESALGPVGAPSWFGAVFDIGFGPAVLFASLLGAAVLVVAFGVVGWRRRHP